MGIDHRCFDIFVPKQFLHRANIVTCLKKMSGKTMPKGMRADGFVYIRQLCGCSDRPLKPAGIQMMTANDPAARID
jgi:hypothetical protein